MPQLITQKDLSRVQKLPFCYLCGKPLTRVDNTRDHVPPESIFAKEHRNTPLVLPVHQQCNQDQSGYDEIIGQLIAVRHGKFPKAEHSRLQLEVYKFNNKEPMLGIAGIRIESVIWRWIRGFHAALYHEYMPIKCRGAVHPPFWMASRENTHLVLRRPLPQEEVFVEQMKKNRQARATDRVICCAKKCLYECTWTPDDQGEWLCLFALRIYDWEKLGDQKLPKRGCVGCYRPLSGMPKNGTKATKLDFPVSNKDPFDPFGE